MKKIGNFLEPALHLLDIEVAGFSPAIHCEDSGLYSYLDRELVVFKGGHGDEMLLRIELVRDSILPEVIPGDSVMISPSRGLQVLLHHKIDNGELLLLARACQSNENRANDETFLYPLLLNVLLSFYLQHLQAEGRAHICLIHACGAVRDGKALLFAGKSGVGKSTVARLLMENGSFKLLGDDMVIVSRGESGWLAHTSPLGGDIPRPRLSNTSAPLEAIYFLSREDATSWRRLDTATALASLISSVVPAYEINNTALQSINEYDQESLSVLMQEASMLASDVPCFSLSYILDEQPWEHIFQADKDRGSR